MLKIPQVAASLLLICVSHFAYANAKTVPAERELPGHYYLRGATDVGSELVLSKSGTFQWTLMYGNTDHFARGTWHQNGHNVILSTAARPATVFRLFQDNEFWNPKSPEADKWVAIVGVPSMGPVAEVEVRFEAKSGKIATAVSGRNGYAIVAMPASEQWLRSGLRRAGSDDEWQWVSVPAERAQARIAGLAIANPESIQPTPFKTLTLRQEKRGLVVDDEAFGLGGVYEK